MPYSDLREFIRDLEQAGELVRIKQEIESGHEIWAINWELNNENGPAFLAEKVKGHTIPVLSNTFGTLKRWAMACGLPTGKRDTEYQEMLADVLHPKNFVPPKVVKSGPCKEVILHGKDVDLRKFPILQWHPNDGGPYISLGIVVSHDERFGRNVGIYRIMVLDKNRCCMLTNMIQDIGIHLGRAMAENKETMPVAVVIGADPAVYEAAAAKTDLRTDEFAFAAAFRGGQPIELVKCETSDLEVPATAEIVLEGELTVKERHKEGPYCEYPGFSEEAMYTPIFNVKCISHRKDPIYITAITGHMRSEERVMTLVMQRAYVTRQCRERITGFKAVHMPGPGRGFTAVVSINKRLPGWGKHAIMQAYAIPYFTTTVNIIIIVDEDIDPSNLDEVFWAISTRVDPERDVILFPPAGVHPLNPAARSRPDALPASGVTDYAICSKMGIDATLKKFGAAEGHFRETPKVVRPDPKMWQKVKANWQKYGFQ